MPFPDRLDAFQLPPGFKLAQLKLYDGTGDLIKHLRGYMLWKVEESLVGANAVDKGLAHNSGNYTYSIGEAKVGCG
ncbi:hypothetical protein LIER_24382 [Lithospermum erythrorhizon]|uniref:Uncharacterized protein n=1 Tax=Lithospermum erythrorhizon TaxID=34254 RepID=A0AAV3R0V0_LITER